MRYSISIIIVCVLMFILQLAIPGFTESLLLNDTSWQEVWRFLTSIFLHGSIGHLLYNMFALFIFGLLLEHFIGSKRFLTVFLVSGILANVVSVFFYPSSLGASGAIFGVIGALVVIRPTMNVLAFGIPMPMIMAGVLYIFIDLIGLLNPTSTTGHIAHLSGIFFGIVFGFLFRPQSRSNIAREKIRVSDQEFYEWENRWMR